MECNNGADPQAPPRPPKLLPRVHKPRAPDPQTPTSLSSACAVTAYVPAPMRASFGLVVAESEVMPPAGSASESLAALTSPPLMDATGVMPSRYHQNHHHYNHNHHSTDLKKPLVPPTLPAPPLPLKLEQIPHPLSDAASFQQVQKLQQLQQQHRHQHMAEQLQHMQKQQQQHMNSISSVTATTATSASSPPPPTIVTNLYDNDTSRLNANVSIIPTNPDLEDYQIYHLTYLPDRTQPSGVAASPPPSQSGHLMSRVTGGVAGVTATNSFTRRRLLGLSGAATTASGALPEAHMPLITIGDSTVSPPVGGGSFLGVGSFLHGVGGTTTEAVSLAQPRPESERHTNEYVETPLRSPGAVHSHAHVHHLQLQHASRSQHPAGEHDDGHTTTHHLLLLPQRQHHQQQRVSMAVAGAAGSANVVATPVITGEPFFQHVQHHSPKGAEAGAALSQSHVTPANAPIVTTPTTTSGNNNNNMASLASPAGQRCCQRVMVVRPPHEPATKLVRGGGVSSTTISDLTQAFGDFAFERSPAAAPITKQPLGGSDKLSPAAADTPFKSHFHDEDTLNSIVASTGGDLTFVPINRGVVNGLTVAGTPILIATAADGGSMGSSTGMAGIVCPRCERCRCEMCQAPRPLPQTWVCNKTCLCSANSVIDYASCLCCVKAIFYHCSSSGGGDIVDDGSGESCVDNPCTCAPYKRSKRWGWLGALSVVLPCLWCYWPMRACVASCEYCYNRVAGRGCRCESQAANSGGLHMAGPLDNVDMLPITQNGPGSGGEIMAGKRAAAATAALAASGQTGGGLALNGGNLKPHHHYHHHHHHHHHECGGATGGGRKGEKRLLDTSLDY